MQEIFQGGANLGYGQKRGTEAYVGGGGGENDTRGGGAMPPPPALSGLPLPIVIVHLLPLRRGQPLYSTRDKGPIPNLSHEEPHRYVYIRWWNVSHFLWNTWNVKNPFMPRCPISTLHHLEGKKGYRKRSSWKDKFRH